MSILTLFQLFFAPPKGWQAVIRRNLSVHGLFLLHVIPFSLIPPIMLYMAGSKGELLFLDLLPQNKLLIVCVAFFIVQLIAVPAMAIMIKQLADIVEAKPTFAQAFTLAAISPTPLWLMPVFLLFPDMAVILIVLSLAMMAAAGFIFYGIPEALNVRDEGKRILLFGAVLTAGVVAAAFLMIITFVMWGSMQSLHLA